MKIINLSLLFTIFCLAVNAQNFTDKINLKKDKAFEIVTMLNQTMNMGGMEMTTNSSTTVSLKVTGNTDTAIKIKTKIEKLRATGEFGGNSVAYDSEKKDSENNPEMAEAMKGKLGVEKEFSVNRKTGLSTDFSSPEKKGDDDPMDNIMNAANGNENASVNEMFFMIPKGKKVGENWTTTTEVNGNKTENKYTLKEIKGNTASIDFNTVSTISQNVPVEGMEMMMNLKMNANGNFTVNTETGILIKKTSKVISEGSTEIMGQSSPINMDSSIETTYSDK